MKKLDASWLIKVRGSLEPIDQTTFQPTSERDLACELKALPRAKNGSKP